MELGQSQLDYLMKRGSNYDRKYKMFELLIEKIPDRLGTVVELFGGVGIQSWYLQREKYIDNHISIDIDDVCNKISNKMLPAVNRISCNCFDYLNTNKIDLLVCDSVFNKKEFENIVRLVSNFDFDNLILTNTGVFNVRFNKQLTYEQYWNELVKQLANYGLYVSDIVYSSDFGMMLIRRKKRETVSINKLVKGMVSKDWREYVSEVYALEDI